MRAYLDPEDNVFAELELLSELFGELGDLDNLFVSLYDLVEVQAQLCVMNHVFPVPIFWEVFAIPEKVKN